jgi:phosphopantetheinyl transferase
MTSVLVLHARLRDGPGLESLAPLLERLPYAKRLELARRDAPERRASLAGISLALEGAAMLRGQAAGADALRFPAGGKPSFVAGPFFSISHGAATVAAALSEDVEVGFDLEDFGPGQRDAGDARARLERWTATEAVLKAAGRGLREARAVELEQSLAAGSLAGAV